jgi:hypothetical protein
MYYPFFALAIPPVAPSLTHLHSHGVAWRRVQ